MQPREDLSMQGKQKETKDEEKAPSDLSRAFQTLFHVYVCS